MMPENAFGRALARALSSYLQIPGTSELGSSTFVSGILMVPVREHVGNRDIAVPVCAAISNNWITKIPKLYVLPDPPWLKKGADWHVFPDRSICFEWRERWTEHLSLIAATSADLADIAAQWMKNAAAHVIHVHHTCHILGRTSWPKAIPVWPHSSQSAAAEYEIEKKLIKLKK
jgi:hypothetical protein